MNAYGEWSDLEIFFFMHQTTHTICKSGHLGEYLNADVLFHLLANISKTFFLSKLFEFYVVVFYYRW